MDEKEIIFNNIYNNLREKYYKIYEERRKKGKKYWIIGIILFIVAMSCLQLANGLGKNEIILVAIAGMSVFAGIKMIGKGDKERNYEEEYKNNVIKEFIQMTGGNFTYNSTVENKKQVYYEYKKSDFNYNLYELYRIDDHIKGKLDKNIIVDIYDVASQIEVKGKNGDNTYPIAFQRFICKYKTTTKQKYKIENTK